ncbi:MAG: class I SAM-dependent methyltransferase [Halanaeroarchaeum sp.]
MTGEGTPPDNRSVVDTYDEIAPHFASKRQHPWPEVEQFVESASGETALDVGCANGRHTELLAAIASRTIGLDASRKLLGEARDRQKAHDFDADLLQGDASRLPLQTSTVDVATYVATMHHFSSREVRVESLNELGRVLSPQGRALVSVWSTKHDRFEETAGFDTTVTFTLPDGTEVPRYYHIYDPAEFGADLAASAALVEREWVSRGNCYAVIGGSA